MSSMPSKYGTTIVPTGDSNNLKTPKEQTRYQQPSPPGQSQYLGKFVLVDEEKEDEDQVGNASQKAKPKNMSKEQEFFEFAVTAQEPEKGVSRIRSLLGAFPKGLSREGGKQVRGALNFFPKLFNFGDFTIDEAEEDRKAEERLNQLFPTQDKFTESALERGGKLATYAPLAAAGGAPAIVGSAARSVVGGFTGEGGKALGLPEWAQTLLEVAPQVAPGLGKNIQPTKAQQSQVDAARRLGLSEEEIAPLIQGEGKQKILTKLSPKRGRTQEALKASQSALGNVFNRLASSLQATGTLNANQTQTFLNELGNVFLNMPSAVRNHVAGDLRDLLRQPLTGSSIINFFQDINHNIGPATRQLGMLKGPIYKALRGISPQLAEDFAMTNSLYSNYATIAQRLKPTVFSDIMGASQALRLMGGVVTGYYPILVETLGESAAKLVAREMLINPRLQNLSRKMIVALNQNLGPVAGRILNSISKEIQKVSPEAALQIESADLNSLFQKGQEEKRK